MLEDYGWFQGKILDDTGIDLTLYKEEQMKRRLFSLCTKYGAHSFREFYTKMNESSDCYQEFLDKMTINVTEFFRNRPRWEVLEELIQTDLSKKNKPLKIWSAACSTGEEPYSLSMVFSKFFSSTDYEILATDLDEKVLNQAKSAIFSEKMLKGLEQNEILRYFKREKNFYTVKPEIKQPITFQKQNLLSATYPKEFDLIVCRNVMIYFTEEAKHSIYTKFAESLNQQGILFVGSTEQIFNPERYQLRSIETFFYEKVSKE